MPDDAIVRVAEPRRAIPEEHPEIARLSAMVLNLLSELAISRERQDTLERVLASAGIIAATAVEDFVPDAQATAERDALRRRQIDKVMQPFRLDAEQAVSKLHKKAAEADHILNDEVSI